MARKSDDMKLGVESKTWEKEEKEAELYIIG